MGFGCFKAISEEYMYSIFDLIGLYRDTNTATPTQHERIVFPFLDNADLELTPHDDVV